MGERELDTGSKKKEKEREPCKIRKGELVPLDTTKAPRELTKKTKKKKKKERNQILWIKTPKKKRNKGRQTA